MGPMFEARPGVEVIVDALVISRAVSLGDWAVVIEDGCGGAIVDREMVGSGSVTSPGAVGITELERLGLNELERLRLNELERLGLNELEPLRLKELERLRVSELERLGLNVLDPLRLKELERLGLNVLEPLAEIEGNGGLRLDEPERLPEIEGIGGGVGLDEPERLPEIEGLGGGVGLDEPERLPDTVGEGVTVDREMVVGLVTVRLDELEQVAKTVDTRSDVMTLVIIRGTDTVVTLPVNVSGPQVLEIQHRNATQRLGKEDWPQSRYGITRTLTIWLRLQGISEAGDGCRRGHRKGGHMRTAGSHDIVNSSQSTGRHRSCPSVQGRKLSSRRKERKERRRMGKGRENNAVRG